MAEAWFTPPQVAEQLAVDSDKIHSWIKRGELEAWNLALDAGGRPRYRISPEALHRFLERRKSPSPPPSRHQKRKCPAGVIDYYPAGN